MTSFDSNLARRRYYWKGEPFPPPPSEAESVSTDGSLRSEGIDSLAGWVGSLDSNESEQFPDVPLDTRLCGYDVIESYLPQGFGLFPLPWIIPRMRSVGGHFI